MKQLKQVNTQITNSFFYPTKYHLSLPLLMFMLVIATSLKATPKIEIDKQSCRFFYQPNNTYSINFQIDIYNTSTAGEALKNIQVKDDLLLTFGLSSRIISSKIQNYWGEQGDTIHTWDWDDTNFTNWDGITNINLFNNGNNSISNLVLYPGGYIHIELCVVVKAGNLPTGIGSGNNWTNTATFVSARTSAGVNLTASNVGNIYTPFIPNNVTIRPIRNRTIITTGIYTNTDHPPVSLDGTYTYDYFVRVKQHPSVVPNPDGASGGTNSLNLTFDMYDIHAYNIPVQAITATKVYGKATLVLNPNFNGYNSVVGGIPVIPDDKLLAGGLGLNDSALVKVTVTLGPTNVKNWLWLSTWSDFNDAGGVYQELPGGATDTLNNPYDQCYCGYFGTILERQSAISVTKSVISSVCSSGLVNKMDVEYEFQVKGLATNNVWLHNLKLVDSISTYSCGSFEGIISPPSIVSTTAYTPPIINTAFNGNTINDMFLGSASDKLGPNESVVVRLKARYNLALRCMPNQYNKAIVSGIDPAGDTMSYIGSNVLILNVEPIVAITTEPSPIAECVGGSLSMSISATGGTPPLGYRWQKSATINGPYSDILGANSVSYTPPSTVVGTYYYRVIVSSASSLSCNPDTSGAVVATIVGDPSVSVAIPPATVCIGTNITLTATQTVSIGTCSIQWQSSPDGTTWTNISGAIGSTYNVTNINTTTRYRAQLVSCTGNGCCD